jgi:lysophospholipid acyltransferase (LPLAT)-like uncharacterized protein
MVPFPWSRGLFLWGAPIYVPRELDESALEVKRLELETVLNRMTAEADRAVNSET